MLALRNLVETRRRLQLRIRGRDVHSGLVMIVQVALILLERFRTLNTLTISQASIREADLSLVNLIAYKIAVLIDRKYELMMATWVTV